MIDDPVRPFKLRMCVAYRVVEENGELVVREAMRPFSPAPNAARVPQVQHWTQNPYVATNTI
jgi:hypothetical protein